VEMLGNNSSLDLVVGSLLTATAGGLYSSCLTVLAVVTTDEGTGDDTVVVGWDDVVTVAAALLPFVARCFCSSICRCLSRRASVSLCRICFCSSGPASGDVATSVDRTVAVISGELPVRVNWSTSRARSIPAMFDDDEETGGASLDTAAAVVVCTIHQHTAIGHLQPSVTWLGRWTFDQVLAGSIPGRGAIRSPRSTQPSIPLG